jgi:hypothetical protein
VILMSQDQMDPNDSRFDDFCACCGLPPGDDRCPAFEDNELMTAVERRLAGALPLRPPCVDCGLPLPAEHADGEPYAIEADTCDECLASARRWAKRGYSGTDRHSDPTTKDDERSWK